MSAQEALPFAVYRAFAMPRETLFTILSRQPWWVTVLVASGMFGIAHLIYPPVAPFVALPFFIVAAYIAFVQWRTGSPVDVGERIAELRAMSWDEFSARVSDAYRRQGYTVAPADGSGYDFKLTRQGRITLLQCRRWKVNQVGVGPLRELVSAIERNDASGGICIAAGEFSAPARKFAAGEPLSLVTGRDLVALIAAAKRKAR
jgi:restriction system protein